MGVYSGAWRAVGMGMGMGMGMGFYSFFSGFWYSFAADGWINGLGRKVGMRMGRKWRMGMRE